MKKRIKIFSPLDACPSNSLEGDHDQLSPVMELTIAMEVTISMDLIIHRKD